MRDVYLDAVKRIKLLQDQVILFELLAEASNEAIQFTLEGFDNYQSEDAIQFLQYWYEGDWPAIQKYYPEFDLNSEAQQALIKKSGGMTT